MGGEGVYSYNGLSDLGRGRGGRKMRNETMDVVGVYVCGIATS